jgi:hypothetical protein
MHATAVYNDTANGERNYETTHFEYAFVHTFTDETQILQVADFNYISWNAGHTANERYLGNELCQTYDYSKFLAAYDRWVWLAAFQLYQRKLGVTDNVTLNSHLQCTEKWHESTHTDPIDYLAQHGKTWADVVQDVKNYYNQFEEERTITTIDANKVIAFLSAGYLATESEQAKQEFHRLANELRKASGQQEK